MLHLEILLRFSVDRRGDFGANTISEERYWTILPDLFPAPDNDLGTMGQDQMVNPNNDLVCQLVK